MFNLRALCVVILCGALAPWAHAGRPLGTDDAGTAEAGECQIEIWAERAADQKALVVAPACGILPGMEIGVDYTKFSPSDGVRGAAGLAFKFSPESWGLKTGIGELNFGLKLGASWAQPAGAGWQRASSGALALATLAVNDELTLHLNIGPERDRASGQTARLTNLALTWAPHERALVFAEMQSNSKKEVFGGTVRAVGARGWLAKDSIGLDLTASRKASGSGTLWTLGFGLYGLKF